MATPHITPSVDDFQLQITHMKRDGYTHNQVLSWLRDQGVIIGITSLKERLQIWGVCRSTRVQLSDELAERVNWLYHHTLLSDSQIASKIADEDRLETTENQVQEIRLLFGWERLNRTSSTVPQQTTQQYVHQLVIGEGRSFGRRWAITYLRHRFGHRARQLDVASALKLLDPDGVASACQVHVKSDSRTTPLLAPIIYGA
jgi:hypothetical protein